MEKNKDYSFYLMMSVLGVAMSLDALLTKAGLKLGYSEDNPLMVKLMEMFGVNIALMMNWVTSIILIVALTIAYSKICSERQQIILKLILFFVLLFKIFVIGVWFGIINILI